MIAAFLLAMTAMYAIGLLVAAVVPSVKAASATGLVLFLAVMAVGGGFSSRNQFPDWLAGVSEYTPFGAAHAAMSDAWTGAAPDPVKLALLAAITLAATGLAALLFRWD